MRPQQTPFQPGAGPDGPVGRFFADMGLSPSLASLLGDAVTFVAVFLAVYLLGKLVALPVFEQLLDRGEMDAHARKPLRKLALGLVVFAALTVALAAAGFGDLLTSLATIGAAATLAVGFALQDVLKNFVAGVFIFADRPFRIGDWIEWDEYSGVVEDISLRVTRVRTFDNELLTVPNSDLTDGVIKNPVANERLRLRVAFGVGYDDDLERATEILVEEAEEHSDVLDDPAPSVRLTELGESDVGLEARIWIADPTRADFVRIRGEYVAAVKRRFDEAGIDIPYPQRVLHGDLAVSDGSLVEAAEADARED